MVIVYTKNKDGKYGFKNYFSTDLKQSWSDILEVYRLRFQIEFLYRDAKQHLGLNHCEARSEEKLNFHIGYSGSICASDFGLVRASDFGSNCATIYGLICSAFRLGDFERRFGLCQF